MTPPDLLDPHFYADIDAMHERMLHAMRAQGPVRHDETNEMWAGVQHHAPLVDVERSADIFLEQRGVWLHHRPHLVRLVTPARDPGRAWPGATGSCMASMSA